MVLFHKILFLCDTEIPSDVNFINIHLATSTCLFSIFSSTKCISILISPVYASTFFYIAGFQT